MSIFEYSEDKKFETQYKGMTIFVWRTDDPMEAPDDDPEAEGPFEIGDWYFSVKELGVEASASIATFDLALELAKRAVDTKSVP